MWYYYWNQQCTDVSVRAESIKDVVLPQDCFIVNESRRSEAFILLLPLFFFLYFKGAVNSYCFLLFSTKKLL